MRKFAAIILVAILILTGVTSAVAAESQFKPTSQTVEAAVERYGNEDIRGWLTVPGTDINRAVAFSPVSNDYYEHRTIEGVQTTASARQPTADYFSCRTEFGSTLRNGSRNIVIFGHNWTNVRPPYRVGVNETDFGFAELPSYNSLEFLNANPYIYFATDKDSGVYKICTVMYTKDTETLAQIQPYTADGPTTLNAYNELIGELGKRTLFTGVDVKSTDTLLTLSTCTRHYGGYTDQRFVVVARLLRSGEKDSDPVEYKVNPNVKEPRLS